jgi:hypothetical protein
MVTGASGTSIVVPAPPAAPSLETALTAPQLSALSTTTRRRVVVNRVLPVHSKNSDPKECLDRIDDMYQLYYDLEVCSGDFHFFTLSRLVQSAWAPSPRLFRVEEVLCAHPSLQPYFTLLMYQFRTNTRPSLTWTSKKTSTRRCAAFWSTGS